jgi:hypothetical protein
VKYLRIFLWLVALHSFVVALLLILLNEDGVRYFGFNGGHPFFQVQGGVFHIVMCVAYLLAASDLPKAKKLIIFIVSAKTIAMIYLMIYYVFVSPITILLIAGLGDGIMALIIFWLWRTIKPEVGNG